jgi:hypothetical protein
MTFKKLGGSVRFFIYKSLGISFLIANLFVVTGCSVDPATQARWERESAEREVQIADKFKQQCRSYGFRDGTDAFAQCVQKAAQDKSAYNERNSPAKILKEFSDSYRQQEIDMWKAMNGRN